LPDFNRMLKKLIFIFLVLAASNAFAQGVDASSSSEGSQGFFRTEDYGGVFIHSNGFGANYRHVQRITGYSKRVYSFELLNMKHQKEAKTFNPYVDDTRGFIYGKVNSLFVFRPAYGKQKILYTKDAKKGVQISRFFLYGPSFGLLKPVYLIIDYPNVIARENTSQEEIFDPSKHSFDNIRTRAPFTKGIEETRFVPGIHVRYAYNFQYAPIDDIHRALEIGITFDAFARRMDMMFFQDPKQFFLTFYVNFQFGKLYI
jgi:hypothetical protein